jgi:hypothetical protein
LIIQEAIPHRGFGRKILSAGFVDDVAALGAGVSVIFPSLMMDVDQGIVSERRQTFGEAINGALLCGSEHFSGCLLAGILTGIQYQIKDIISAPVKPAKSRE